MTKKTVKSQLEIMEEYFSKKMEDTYAEVYDGNIGEKEVSIYCSGDWKHDHGHLDVTMEDLGYTPKGEFNVEDTGSDWYSSVHRFEFTKTSINRIAVLKASIKKYTDLNIGKDIIKHLEKEIKDLNKLHKALGF